MMICSFASIVRKSGVDVDGLANLPDAQAASKIREALKTPSEWALAKLVLQFTSVIKQFLAPGELSPHKICGYLYDLSTAVSAFCRDCKVIGSEEMEGRVMLCAATVKVMRKCMHLLGITPLERI